MDHPGSSSHSYRRHDEQKRRNALGNSKPSQGWCQTGYAVSGARKEMVIAKPLHTWTRKCSIAVSYFILCIFGEFIHSLHKSRNRVNLLLIAQKILPDRNIILVILLIYRKKKWVNVGPSSCTLKVFKWVPGKFIYWNIILICQIPLFCTRARFVTANLKLPSWL